MKCNKKMNMSQFEEQNVRKREREREREDKQERFKVSATYIEKKNYRFLKHGNSGANYYNSKRL